MGNLLNSTISTKQFLIDAIDEFCKRKATESTGQQDGLIQFCTVNSKEYVRSVFNTTKDKWAPRLFYSINLWSIIAEHVDRHEKNSNKFLYCDPHELCKIVMRVEITSGFIRNIHTFISYWPALVNSVFQMHDNLLNYNGPNWLHNTWRLDAQQIIREKLDLLLKTCKTTIAYEWPIPLERVQAIQNMFTLMPVPYLQRILDIHMNLEIFRYTSIAFQCQLFRYLSSRVYEFDFLSMRKITYYTRPSMPILEHQKSNHELLKRYDQFQDAVYRKLDNVLSITVLNAIVIQYLCTQVNEEIFLVQDHALVATNENDATFNTETRRLELFCVYKRQRSFDKQSSSVSVNQYELRSTRW